MERNITKTLRRYTKIITCVLIFSLVVGVCKDKSSFHKLEILG